MTTITAVREWARRSGATGSIPRWAVGTLTLAGVAVSVAAIGFTVERLSHNALSTHGPFDLSVYMAGARAIRSGSPLYGPAFAATSPSHFPFTDPPFAAIALVPLSYLALGQLAWGWDIVSCVVLGGCVSLAFRPLRRRLGSPVAALVLTSLALIARPVYDDLVYGQVDVLLMGAAVFACASRRSRPGRATLVGLAAAFKVVPGIFIVYLVLARRWRMAWAAAGAWAAATALGFALRPGASASYFGRLLWQTGRPGNANSFLNQSMWGVLGRAHLGRWALPALALAVGAVVIVGLARSVRASRRGDAMAAVVLVGLVSVVASPISWIHEAVWLVPAAGVLVGDGRLRGLREQGARFAGLAVAGAAGVAVAGLLAAGVPYLVSQRLSHGPLAQLVMDTYGIAAAILALTGLGRRSTAAASTPVPDREAAVGEAAEGVSGIAAVDQAPAALRPG